MIKVLLLFIITIIPVLSQSKNTKSKSAKTPAVTKTAEENKQEPEEKELEDWEKDLRQVEKNEKREKTSFTTDPETEKSSSNTEDWEKDLEKDIKEQEKKSKTFRDSRGTTSPAQSGNQQNRSAQNLMMDVHAAIDIVGTYDRYKPRKTENQLDVRTAEFGFSGAVDQLVRGYFLGAAHNENGEYKFEVHEAWAFFPFLPGNMTLKAGTMFLDIGRLNKIHAHDRAFTVAPIVHEKFIGWESLFDTGAEVSILLPWSFITQELVIGATNGKKLGHSHNEGIRKNNPLGYVHLKNFYYFGNNWGTQFGFTGLRYEPSEDRKNEKYMYGIDAVLKWNRSNLRDFSLMAEYWYNIEMFPEEYTFVNNYVNRTKAPKKIQWGHYIFAEYRFHQQWSAGFRYDYYTDESLKTKQNYKADNFIEAQTLQLTFHPSEFSYIRGTVERRFIQDLTLEQDREVKEYKYMIQCVLILGSHPAHAY